MILIAESGSTKTTWVLVEDGRRMQTFTSSGLNPVTQSREHILGVIKTEVNPFIAGHSFNRLYYYGAGCSSAEYNKIMYSCLKNFYNKAEISVEHDLLAAARALWHEEKGIVSILGTGSNSCIFDGQLITGGVPSLGYILGDEGSGAFMGKMLMKDYLYKRLPESISEKLRLEYQLTKDKILDKVYKMPNPNRWLASFSIFIRDNIKDPYMQSLVGYSFDKFFECHISAYKEFSDLPLGAVGSIAFHYKDFLAETAEKYGFRLKKVIKSPVDELVRYHVEELKVS